jgi:riboflavin kinase/FMN adenylyltransferase
LWPELGEQGAAVTIGNYDGVHLGHQTVLADLAERAAALGGIPRAVLTFDPHPLTVLAPERAPKLLTTIEQRIEILDYLGVDIVGVLPFETVRTMSPHEFVCDVLVWGLGARVVAVGTNFRFGHERAGDVATLREEGQRFGFEVEAVPLLTGDGPLSSSAVRGMIADGSVEDARQALGRAFELRGTVISGDRRGRVIGFPTANLRPPEDMVVPARGVYAARVRVGVRLFPAVVNIGVRPTFDGAHREVVEAHLLDFEDELYGREIGMLFEHRLRDERQFAGVEELVEQIGRDVTAAREVLE